MNPARGSYEQSIIEAQKARDVRLGKIPIREVADAAPQVSEPVIEEEPKRLTVLSIEEIIDVTARVREVRGNAVYSSHDICRDVAQRHRMTIEELRSPRRARKYVEARQEAAYLLCRLTSLSYPAIGRILDRDHTSIIHSVRKYIERHGLPSIDDRQGWSPWEAERSAMARKREDMVVRYFDQGFDAKQIAARLNTTVNAVRGIVYRARRRDETSGIPELERSFA